MTAAPLVLPYLDRSPQFAGPLLECAPDAAVLGRVRIGRGGRLCALSVMRADGHDVTAGDDFFLGARSTLHIAHETYPASVGDRVAVGAYACVHACTIGSDCVIEDEVVVLDGAVVEDGVILERGSIVFPRARVARGQVYAGIPAKPVRAVAAGEIAERRARLMRTGVGCDLAGPRTGAPARLECDPGVFIASTARVRGSLRAQTGSSVWFACDLDAGRAGIALGQNVNVQDNTLIRCITGQGVSIGRDSTIGHNARLADCTIGEQSLVGIGAVVAPGTVIEDRVLLAAGARTEPGQVLKSGWVWAGSPAKQRLPLDDAKQAMVRQTIAVYCRYASDFLAAQSRLPQALAS